MSNMKKKIFAAMLTTVLTTSILTPTAFACYGVRAMGMGGAFIAVADDVEAVYWNPAGLADLKEPQVGWSRLTNERGEHNYLDIYEFVMPLEKGDSGIGIHYTNDLDCPVYPPKDVKKSYFTDDKTWDHKYNYKSQWWTISYGKRINENLSYGINLKKTTESYDSYDLNGVTYPDKSNEDGMGLDVSFLYKESEKLSYGLLLQNIVNVRPGIAYRTDDKTIIAAAYYNLLQAGGSEAAHGFAFGVERQLDDIFTLRAGYYLSRPTYGVGAKLNKDLELNVAKGGNRIDIGAQAKL